MKHQYNMTLYAVLA